MIGNDGSGATKTMRKVAIMAAAGWLFGAGMPAGACPEGDAAASGAASRAATSTATEPAYALHELSASGIRHFPDASAAYDRAIALLAPEPWLTHLDGPSALNRIVLVDGAEYLLASACKNHDCAENNIVLLYSAEQDTVYGLVYRDGGHIPVGLPPAEVARELEKFWWQAFR